MPRKLEILGYGFPSPRAFEKVHLRLALSKAQGLCNPGKVLCLLFELLHKVFEVWKAQPTIQNKFVV